MSDSRVLPVHIRRNRFDPVAELGRLRVEQPVSRTEMVFGSMSVPVWLVTRYDDVREVLSDATRFGNERPRRGPRGRRPGSDPGVPLLFGPGFLIGYDPPRHTWLRRMLTPEFTVRRMRELQPRVETIVAQHLDAMAAAGPPVDLVSAFALPIPSLVICELLGVPYADRAGFQRRSNAQLDGSLPFEQRMAAVHESRAYMAELVAAHRRNPGEDMLGTLIREHGAEISDAELAGLGSLLLLAGHETTSNMLGLGTLLLLQHPEAFARLRDDPTIVDQAVEELLRYLSVVHSVLVRTALVDVTLGGQRIRAGDRVVCSLPSANRDRALAEYVASTGGAADTDMDAFDITRPPVPHVAFGHGIHHCLGAPLARMELRVAFPALLRRFPTLRLAVPFDEVEFRAYAVVYGVESLPVRW